MILLASSTAQLHSRDIMTTLYESRLVQPRPSNPGPNGVKPIMKLENLSKISKDIFSIFSFTQYFKGQFKKNVILADLSSRHYAMAKSAAAVSICILLHKGLLLELYPMI